MIRSQLLSLGLAAVALAGAAQAQDPEAVRKRFLLGAPASPGAQAGGPAELWRGAPGTNTGTPLAFGPGMGDFFFGGDFQAETRGEKRADGSWTDNRRNEGAISLGFGLGDATDGIGLSTVVTSLSPFRPGSGKRAALSFSVFRNVTPTLAIAVGVENALISGGGGTGGSDSWYGVVSKIMQNPGSTWLKALTLSGGIGNGRFRMTEDIDSGNETVNVFGSAAAMVHEQFSVITDWTGQDLNIGISIVPFKKFPFAFTPAVADVLGLASSWPRLMIGAGIGMHF